MAAPGGTEIVLLGSFQVRLGGTPVDASYWRRRPAANLVKVLSLAPERRLHREQVLDLLWPELAPAEASPRLHKAVHFARQALDDRDALSTEGASLQLLPGTDVAVDVLAFEAAAATALDAGAEPDAVAAALDRYTGELLPDDRYEPWTEARRAHLAHLHRQLLRAAGRWAELVRLDPTDEAAHVALMRSHLRRGEPAAALGQYDQLAAALQAELGVAPPQEAAALRSSAVARLADASTPPADELPVQSIRFAHAPDGTRLAYAVVGDGPPLVRAANWLTHLEYDWESTIWRHWLLELSRRFRLLRYDERGCGLSDWDATPFSMAAWVEDLSTVVDAAGLDRFPLLGVSQGAAVAVEYAVAHPERVSALVLYGGYVHGPVRRATTEKGRRAAILLPELAELGWGSDEPSFRQVFTGRFIPGGSREQWDEFNELQRRTTSPANAARFLRAFGGIDVSASAAKVRCPTLVAHVRGDRMPPLAQGRLLASLVPGSRFVSLEGDNHVMLASDPAWPRFLAEVDRFLATTT